MSGYFTNYSFSPSMEDNLLHSMIHFNCILIVMHFRNQIRVVFQSQPMNSEMLLCWQQVPCSAACSAITSGQDADVLASGAL